jgi:hypothetical protein
MAGGGPTLAPTSPPCARYCEEIGYLDWAAGQDWMVESHVRARTGASLRTHQHRTVANYLLLRELAPELPFIATLQGESVADYQRCADLYERHGVDLAALPRVGGREHLSTPSQRRGGTDRALAGWPRAALAHLRGEGPRPGPLCRRDLL